MESTLFYSLAIETAANLWEVLESQDPIWISSCFLTFDSMFYFQVHFSIFWEEMRNVPYFMHARIPHAAATEETGCCCFSFGCSWKVSHLKQFLAEPWFNYQTNWKVPNLINCRNLKKKKSTDNHACMLVSKTISVTCLSDDWSYNPALKSEPTHDPYHLFDSYGFRAVTIPHDLKIISSNLTKVWRILQSDVCSSPDTL